MDKENIFGKNIKSLRKENHLSQQSFGSMFGIDQSTIAKIEAGKTEINFTTLLNIANRFNLSLDYLFGRKKETSTEEVEVLGTDQRAIQKLAKKLDDAQASQVYNYMLFVIDQKNQKYENYDF